MPDPKIAPPPTPHQTEMMRMLRLEQRATPEHAIAAEVAALRDEIAALREELRPVPSLIATGRDVLAEFRRLRCEA